MTHFIDDLAWVWRMFKIRRARRSLFFSQRKAYDEALRPSVGSGVVAYPDAFYYVQEHDMQRAAAAART
jgi:hypothetical protein